jgi:PAS domain S-box-containing protein
MSRVTEGNGGQIGSGLLRALIAGSSDGIHVVDLATGRFLDANESGCRILGYRREELLRLTVFDVTVGVDQARFEATGARLKKEGHATLEVLHRRKDGTLFPVEASLSLVTLDRPYVVVIIRDMTGIEALRQSEARYRTLVENIPQMIFIKDRNCRFISVNKNFARDLGVAPEECAGKEDYDFFPKELADKYRADDMRIMETGTATEFEEKHVHEGREFWVHTVKTPVRDQNGGIIGLFGIFWDITEPKRAEEALRESESKLRAIFECSRDAIGISMKGAHVFVNPAYLKMFGFESNEQITGTSILDKIAPSHRERALRHMEQRAAGENFPTFYESRGRKTNGEEFDMEVRVSTYQLHGEIYTIATIRDITERKQAEELNARLAMAVEQASETIVITDTQGTILYANPAFEKTSGYARTEAVGQNARLLKSGRQDVEFYRRMWDILGRGGIWQGHFVNRHKNGALYEEEATISPVRDAAGKTINYVAVKRDVTREVQLEAQFRQSQKMEAVGQLAGGVAHDFNNILMAMLMQAELAESVENLPEVARDCIREIRAYTERAANLTRQLLLFSRRQVMQPRDIDLNEVVTNMGKMLQRIIGEDIRLQLRLHPAPLLTRADAGMLEQALMNLAVNARDAMRKGGRLLIETAEKTVDESIAQVDLDAAPGRYVCLIVSDTGCGIPPELLPRIFEPFFTTKEPGKGTGLGLATVFGIVKQHKGWLKVDSKPGQGVKFHIFLPAGNAAADLPETVTPSKPRGGTETILLVEDEWAVRTLTRAILKRHGYKVLDAPTGIEALKLWQEHGGAAALLLTDLVMPASMSGQELARQLRAEHAQLKVIYISGYSTGIAGQELQLRKGERFIQKPFGPDQLLGTIRQCLDE